jgi:hypothetical protein
MRPHFSWGEQFQHNSGDSRRGNADVYLENWNTVIARSASDDLSAVAFLAKAEAIQNCLCGSISGLLRLRSQ